MNIVFSLLAGLGFGLAMYFRKISVSKIGMTGVIFETVIEAILSVILVLLLFPFNFTDIFSKQIGIIFSVFAGFAATMGVIGFFLAAKNGPILLPSIFTPILSATTASLLALLILKEPITPIKLIGLIITLTGLFIFIRF